MQRTPAPAFLALALGFLPVAVSRAAISVTDFTAENHSASIPGSWVAASNTAIQLLNSNPTVFYSPDGALHRAYEGTVGVSTSTDDDFIGFVVGFTPGALASAVTAQYVLIDWKQATQSLDGYNAPRGLALSLVTGRPANASQGFWGHQGDVQEIARGATLGATGWQDLATYTFRLEYTPGNLLFHVNNVLQFDLSAQDIGGASFTLPNGRFGFYAMSQEQVSFTLTSVEAIPEPSASLLVLLGFACCAAGHRSRAS